MIKVIRMTALVLTVAIGVFGVDHSFPKIASFQLKPYKEKLFRYRKPIVIEDEGNFLLVPYNPKRDINRRDAIPVRKVKSYYTSIRPLPYQKELSLHVNGRNITYFAVGALDGGANVTTLFIHGRHGSRHLGFDDERFGGNFNRLKNLMFNNDGIYISPDFTNFGEEGREDIEALLLKYRPLTKGSLIIACGSMGANICWRLANKSSSRKLIDGMIIVSGFPASRFPASLYGRGVRKLPVYMAHGNADPVYAWQAQKDFYQRLRKAGQSVRYVVFDGGNHGVPVRMIDWRHALNWILEFQN